MAWNGSDSKQTDAVQASEVKKDAGASPKRPYLRGLAAGLIVVALGGAALWHFGKTRPSVAPREPSALKPKVSNAITEVKPAPAKAKPKAEEPSAPPASTNSPKWVAAKGLDPALFPYKDGRKVLSTFTNNWDQIVDICIMPNGRSRKVIRNAKPPIFEHATDQLIAVALSGSNDEELPPLPIGDNMEAEFFESLKTPIRIKDDDSDAVRQAKENVIEARKVIDEELRKGRSFKEVLDEHLAQRKSNAEMRQTAMETVRELQADGDTKTMNEYIKKVNGLLRDKGIGEISQPADNPKRRRR